jgi:hypothetical protein
MFVLDLAEQRRRPNIGHRLLGKWGWIALGMHHRPIHHVWDGLVDRGGVANLLQQRKLPIGDLGELSDCIRQGFAGRRQPLTGTPAIPNVLAQQIGACSHDWMAGIAFFDFLLDDNRFLDRGKVTHDGGRVDWRRGRTFDLRRGLFDESEHVGEEFLRTVALRKADLAVRKLTVRATFHVPPPFPERGLRQRAESGSAALRLPLRQHAEPHPNRSAWAAVKRKLAGWADLEEIRGKPANKIGRRTPRAVVSAFCGGTADYFADYIGGYTLRHLHTHASRKRCFSGVSRGEKMADRI